MIEKYNQSFIVELYGSDPLLEDFEDLAEDLIAFSGADVIMLYGGPARRLFKDRFDVIFPS